MNIIRIVFGVILALVLLVAVVGFIRFNFTNEGDIIPGVNANAVEFTCPNGYGGSAVYYAPNKPGGVMQKLALTITKDGASTTYDMVPARSASGARFETKDGTHSFWEHQDTFRFAQGDSVIAECVKKEEATPTPQSGAMTESDARIIAEASCIKNKGEVLSSGIYNYDENEWWFQASLQEKKSGCASQCIVSEATKAARIYWQCPATID